MTFCTPMLDRKPARPCLLVIEDNRDTAELLFTLLSDTYDVQMGHSYADGLRLASDGPYHLLVFDINLGPGPTGADLLQTLRQQDGFRNTPAMAVTAFGPRYGGQEWFRDAGFDAYLRKPFDFDELMAVISRLLVEGRSRQRSDVAA